MRIRTGPPVKGPDFFDREGELARLPEQLERGNILLLAPRRVGKTSLLNRVADVAEDWGYEAVYATAAKAADEAAFLQDLLKALGTRASGRKLLDTLVEGPIGRFLAHVDKVEVAGVGFDLEKPNAAWESVGETLFDELEASDPHWLLMVDELPIFVLKLMRLDASGVRARRFLDWFRSLRQRTDVADQVRWILAGSIGLDTVTSRSNLGDTINDLHLQTLGPFDRTTADRFFQAVCEGHGRSMSDDVRGDVLDRVGWLIPYHLQIVAAEIFDRVPAGDGDVTLEDVDAAFETLLSPAKKAYFDYWRQRLVEELGEPECHWARALLDAVAADDEGATRDTLAQSLHAQRGDLGDAGGHLRFLLDVLESDGYLVVEEGRYMFRSPLLRSFWRRRVMP